MENLNINHFHVIYWLELLQVAQIFHKTPLTMIEIKPCKELRKTIYFHVSWNISEICGGENFFPQYFEVQMDFYLALLKPTAAL